MWKLRSTDANIGVVGLGYVGLPLALALARHFPVKGYDASSARLTALRNGEDTTGEVDPMLLLGTNMRFESTPASLSDCNVFIVTVPTPIDETEIPDLTALLDASCEIGKVLKPGSVIVFESTVYPGATEDVCGPQLERSSGLRCGQDFFLGYSPERINPGDKNYTVEKVTKVVSGQTPEVAHFLEEIYGAAIPAGIHLAPDIRTAEAAKVIENAQRDVNIAFINEVTIIFKKMGIDVRDVLSAAGTKWNFLNFSPGLVGGHCIGVDPFYLAHAAKEVGHEPEVILAGRRINDSMARFVADEINIRLKGPSRILVLGLAFKENVSDLRNSKVVDLILALRKEGHEVDTHDPLAKADEAKNLYGIEVLTNLEDAVGYQAVIGAVAHDAYYQISPADFDRILKEDGLLVDLKGMWRSISLKKPIRRWHL